MARRPIFPAIPLALLASMCSAIVLLAAPWAATAARDVTSLRQQVEAVETRQARLDARAGAAAVRHNAAMDRVDAALANAARTRVEFARTKGQLAVARHALAERLVNLYQRPEPDLVDLVVSSGSLTDLVTRSEALQSAAGQDARLLDQIRARRVKLRATQARLARAIADGRREALVAARERGRITAALRAQRAVVAEARGELRAALTARTQERVRAARAKGSADIPVAASGTEPVFPVAGPATFSDDWMASRGGRYHEGIDIMAARGAPVVAVVSGTIFRIGTTPISGNRFWLRAANGDEYFYCHMDGFAPAAREGASVKAGTVLAYNGDTGDARGTTPHLHFEIHPGGGGPIRPFPLVSSWPRVA
jgi:peptidoglycan LD-endopeptidase LytH